MLNLHPKSKSSGGTGNVFRVTSFAGLAGASAKVLRDYDRIGVFRPAFIDPSTGYRMYSAAQLPQLRRVLALRDLGVGLGDIRSLVEERSDLEEVLDRRRSALVAEREELDRRLRALGIELDADGGTLGRDEVVVRTIKPELVAMLDVDTVSGKDVERAFYELEAAVRDAGVRASRPPGAVLTAMRTDVFVPVRRASAGIRTERLGACRAATVIHRGRYETLSATRQALESWVVEIGRTVVEPVRILYLQFGAESELRLPGEFLARADADFLTEVQVPFA
jgi:DNA-binding transcriptional MerR regulator